MAIKARSYHTNNFVEIVLASPVIIALFFGSVEISRFMITTHKVEHAAIAISDLVARSTNINTDDPSALLVTVDRAMQSFNFDDNSYVVISSISRLGNDMPKINWQYRNGMRSAASQIGNSGEDAILPNGMKLNPNEILIIAEVYYHFRPLFLSDLIMLDNPTIYKIGMYKPHLDKHITLDS